MYQELRDYCDATENSCELAEIVMYAGWHFVLDQERYLAEAAGHKSLANALARILDEARCADEATARMTSSRKSDCSQPAPRIAGVMNLVQTSRSLRSDFCMCHRFATNRNCTMNAASKVSRRYEDNTAARLIDCPRKGAATGTWQPQRVVSAEPPGRIVVGSTRVRGKCLFHK